MNLNNAISAMTGFNLPFKCKLPSRFSTTVVWNEGKYYYYHVTNRSNQTSNRVRVVKVKWSDLEKKVVSPELLSFTSGGQYRLFEIIHYLLDETGTFSGLPVSYTNDQCANFYCAHILGWSFKVQYAIAGNSPFGLYSSALDWPLRIVRVPIFIGVVGDYVYFYTSSCAVKQPAIRRVKYDGTTDEPVRYSTLSFPYNITSVPTASFAQDGGFRWYKFVYDNNNPEICLCSYDPNNNPTSVSYQPCSIDTLPEEMNFKNYIPNGTLAHGNVINAELVEKDGKKYIVLMPMNFVGMVGSGFDQSKNVFNSNLHFNPACMKMYLFEIVSDTELRFVGSKNIPWNTLYIAPPRERGDWTKCFVIWTPEKAYFCRLTCDERVYEIYYTLSFVTRSDYPEHLYCLTYDDDLIGIGTLSSYYLRNTDYQIWLPTHLYLLSENLPEIIDVIPERDYYDYQGQPINSYLLLDIKNYLGDRIRSVVRLRITTSNAVFENGSRVIEVTSSTEQPTRVNFTVNGRGSIEIVVEYVKPIFEQ
jgi:hypothetical protein